MSTEDDVSHFPAEPRTICGSTGLVYCMACCRLLDSDRCGPTAAANQPCRPAPITLRGVPTS